MAIVWVAAVDHVIGATAGFVGLQINHYKEGLIMTNAELSALLSEAKDAQKKFDAEGLYSRSPMWRITRGRAESAWGLLYDAILEAEPCTVLLESGDSRTVCTVGALTSDQMMYYSPSANAKHTMYGISLRSVASIEKVDAEE